MRITVNGKRAEFSLKREVEVTKWNAAAGLMLGNSEAAKSINQYIAYWRQLAYDAQEKMINLRYRLLPYIYSTSWDVSHNDGTFMRPLVMDFAADSKTHEVGGEFLFGRSLLVAPVTRPEVTEWSVYLPQGADWWDFWSNEKQQDRQTLNHSVSSEDKARPLTIEERESSFPNMLKSRKFKVVLVGQDSGTGDRPMKGRKTISYAGKKKSIKL